MVIYFLTGNDNKFDEAKSILGDNILIDQLKLDLVEIQEIDPKKVIAHKLLEAVKNKPGAEFIVEDTSLIIEGMNGLPGPLIKWFLKSIKSEGIVELTKTYGTKAKAMAIIGHYKAGDINYYKGIVEGKIVQKRGESNFGWDPIFIPEGYKLTFAEMTKEEKNAISHRRKAFVKFKGSFN